jgi:hypothetical protein
MRRSKREHEYLFRYITKTSFAKALFRRNVRLRFQLISRCSKGDANMKGSTMCKQSNRVIAAATAAAIALTSASFAPAVAAPASGKSPAAATAGDVEFSSRKRVRHRGNRAALGAVMGVFGTIAAIAAANAARDRYERHYFRGYYGPYGYGPYGYGPYGAYPPGYHPPVYEPYVYPY